jgi:hypothetical protein
MPGRIKPPLVELGEHRSGGGFARGRSLQRAQQGGDAPKHRCKDDGVGSKAGCEVAFCQHGTDLWPVQEPDLLIVASNGRVPHLSQERGLVPIRPVDGFNRHTCGVGDFGDRGPSVAWPDEQIVCRSNDPLPRLNGLFATPRRPVSPLDFWFHWIQAYCIENSLAVSESLG